uniref:Uncharacterized protein n=1 Tax=Megaselia scalaris TaxID=36166 RepID=T1GDK5_MEGSC
METVRLRTEAQVDETCTTAATLRTTSLEFVLLFCVTRWKPINERLCNMYAPYKSRMFLHYHNLRSCFQGRR